MKANCKDCDGTGTLPGYHAEDDGKCCDEPVKYRCDNGGEDIPEDELEDYELSAHEHDCEKCKNLGLSC